MQEKSSGYVLPIIVVAQFACTSLWFAGNAVIGDLQSVFGLAPQSLGHLTSAVQFGFISGTLVFAILSIADRFSPSKVFFVSALFGAVFNLAFAFSESFYTMIAWRVLTGFMLAGIYPVGMKIAADYHEKGLGKALGFLVGALVLGTAFPHLIKTFSTSLPWRTVIFATSTFALAGGIAVLAFVKDGPFRKKSQHVNLSQFVNVFRSKNFRQAAFGYFGHMWELYTFWAFLPVLIVYYAGLNSKEIEVPLFSFLVIAVGGFACVAGGYLSGRFGSNRVAFYSLMCSGLCCVISPLIFDTSIVVFLAFLFVWGTTVISDSPQFSTLVAQHAPAENKGTALTIVNSIGFAITIISIQGVNLAMASIEMKYLMLLLVPGPAVGLIAFRKQLT